ncbi:hypothetical protein MRB53_004993 [Persea americana]|uniref:Uncharacterized protein n=1 Tax=Persea americana TaxID=3435 RepID=A0ACC2MC63_PERAE|nr:hypothetical protein MRB53_004993 [Persea americana]
MVVEENVDPLSTALNAHVALQEKYTVCADTGVVNPVYMTMTLTASLDEEKGGETRYVEACKDLPSIELVPRLPKEDLDEALKIVRVAAILGSLKKVE